MRIADALKMYRKRSKYDVSSKLTTVFSKDLDPEHILSEYPRPNLVRSSYCNLNGYWDYSICKDGFLQNLDLTFPSSYDGKILVPFSPETSLSGVEKTVLPDDILWYHRSFSLNDSLSDKHLILHFGAVDQICNLWINGKFICKHTGGYLPFSADISNAVVSGENQILLQVRDTTDSSYHSRGKQKLKNGGMFYQCQSGIWQTVWYEIVPENYIKALQIHTDFERQTVSFSFDLSTLAGNDQNTKHISTTFDPAMCISISFQGKELVSLENTSFSTKIKINAFYPWSPESPNLYDVTIQIGEDRIKTYFAFRKIELRRVEDSGLVNSNQLFLNHKPYFMNGVLDQGYWPESLMTPPSYAAYEFDILEMKKLGFNMIRKHIKIEPLYFYYLCDKLGMLVWQDMVNGGTDYGLSVALSIPMGAILSRDHMSDSHYLLNSRKSMDGRREWLSECKKTIELLKFFPSIVVWVSFNEGWGQFDAIKVCNMIRRLDPTRLVDHASGWFDQGGGHFKSEHNYFKKLKVHPDQNRAYVLSEFGGIVYRVEKHSFRNHTFGYLTCNSLEEFQLKYKSLFQEIDGLKNQGMSACVYTQLSDIEEEMNGILTYDRRINKLDLN